MTPQGDEAENKTTRIGDHLFQYAIDRSELKWVMSTLPPGADIHVHKVEFELQALKIISVGWCLSFYLENNPFKDPLLDAYWRAVYEFSGSLSQTAGLMTAEDMDYFGALHERLDTYVAAMAASPDGGHPERVIAPVFAQLCGDRDDTVMHLAGSKMFVTAVAAVKEYLETAGML